MDVVLIPAYEPDETVVQLTNTLCQMGFTIVVVDDGSGNPYAPIFSALQEKAHVVTLPQNRGKGAALKAGIRYIMENLPECEQVITCDADGQHKPKDVERVAEELHKGNTFVLTLRQRNGKIPFRSWIGNALSQWVYALLTHKYLPDNQSGLRGFSACHLPWLVQVKKSNYDYEMNVLYVAATRGIAIHTLPIEAVYINDNASSHFNPVKDTLKIYKSLFSLAGGTLLGFLFGEGLLVLLEQFLETTALPYLLPWVGLMSLLCSMALNRLFFFKQTVSLLQYGKSAGISFLLYVVYGLFSLVLVWLLPNTPMAAVFTLMWAVCLPLRYGVYRVCFNRKNK